MKKKILFVLIGIVIISIIIVGVIIIANNYSKKNTYKIIWENYDGSLLELDENVKEGSTPSYDGNTPVKPEDDDYKYEFSGWTPDLDIVMNDATYVAKYNKVEKDKYYVVIFDSDCDINVESQNIKRGEKINKPSISNREGYTLIGWYFDNTEWNFSNDVVNDNITLKARWQLNKYNLLLNIDNNDAGIIDDISGIYNYNETITIKATLNQGYTFDGWYNGNIKISNDLEYTLNMPALDITLTAKFIPDTNTPYKVEHYLQNIDDDGYPTDPFEIDNLNGTTDTLTEGEVNTYEGFTSPSITQVNINGDGSTVIELYYTRNSYKVKLRINNDKAGTISGSGTYKYGKEVTIVAETNPGYTFDGWYDGNSFVSIDATYNFIMPANVIELNAVFTVNTNTPYKVEHYLQNIDDDGYPTDPFEIDNLSGTTDTLTNGEVNTYEGFTSPSITQLNINGDGSTVIELYYTRNSYTLTLGINNDKAGTISGSGTYKYGKEVTIVAETNPGYTFIGWYDGENEITKNPSYKFNMQAAGLKYKAKYTANTNTPYKMEHYLQNIDDDGYPTDPFEVDNLSGTTDTLTNGEVNTYEGFTSPSITQLNINGDGSTVIELYYTRNSYTLTLGINNDKAGTISGSGVYKYGKEVIIVAETNSGYTFIGWYNGDNELTKNPSYKFNMLAAGLTYTAKYSANTNTAYKVVHYLQNIDDDGYPTDPFEIDNLSGTTDTLTNGEVNTYEGFTSSSITQVNINGDGSTVIELYYTRNSYTLTLGINNDKAGTISGSGTYKYGKEVTIIAEVNPGYTFIGWYDGENEITKNPSYKFNMQAAGLTYTAKYSANTNTAYKVVHYKETPSGGAFTSADTDYLTGTTGTLTKASAKEYYGFNSPIIQQESIKGDGSTTIIIYYYRKQSVITLEKNYNAGTVTGAGVYKYEKEITISAITEDDDYVFDGWYYGSTKWTDAPSFTYKVGTLPMVFTAQWTRKPLSYFNYTENGDVITIHSVKDTSMTEIVVPDNVTYIDEGAFSGCSYLEKLTIPFIGYSNSTNYPINYPFGYIFGKTNYYNSYEAYQSGSDDSGTYYIPKKLYDITITNEDEISNGVFWNVTSMLTLTIPNTITSLSGDIFHGCDKLIELYNLSEIYVDKYSHVFSFNLKAIHTDSDEESIIFNYDDFIFSYVNNICTLESYVGDLTSVELPLSFYYKDNLINSYNLGEYTFKGCNNITNIIIPSFIEKIGKWTFDGCTSLDYNLFDNAYYIGNTDNPYLILMKSAYTYIHDCIISESCKFIYSYAFSQCVDLSSIIIPNNVVMIDLEAFSGCTNLTNVSLSNNLVYISQLAFYNTGITSIEIYEGVTEIEIFAFYNCQSLENVILPKSLTYLGNMLFEDCPLITSVSYNGTTTEWNNLIAYCGSGWKGSSSITKIVCSDGEILV